MSAYIPFSLALLSISLSTSYLYSLARTASDDDHQQSQPHPSSSASSSAASRLAGAVPVFSGPRPWPANPFTAPGAQQPTASSSQSQTAAESVYSPTSTLSDFDFETFTFKLPTFTAQKSLDNMPSDGELAGNALQEESILRFPSFKMEDAVTLGMNLRKRFRVSGRHSKGKGCVISIQTMQGATMFACAVGEGSDVSLDSWWHIEGMIKVVRRTGHSTFYIERGSNAIGKPADQLGLPFPEYRLDGGAFPIWLQNSTVGPIGIIAIYSGSSIEDHNLVVSTLKSYFQKISNADRSPRTSTDVLDH